MPKLCLRRLCGVVALLVADQHDLAPAERGQAAHDRPIVAVERGRRASGTKSSNAMRDVIAEMRALGMPRDLRLLPGRELGIGAGAAARRLSLLELARSPQSMSTSSPYFGGRAQVGDARLAARRPASRIRDR